MVIDRLRLKTIKVSVPFDIGGISIVVDSSQQKAAWALYVELITRIATQPLDEKEGLLREALSSLHSVFEVTRIILKDAGPGVAHGPDSLGPVAIEVLNKGLRPFTAKWHPKLLAYEQSRPQDMSQFEHEHQWKDYAELREELEDLQKKMIEYANALALISGAKFTGRYIHDGDPETWGLV
jgi:hypothetical protein